MTKTVTTVLVAATLSAFAAETTDNTPLDTTGGVTLNVATDDTLIYKGKISGSGLLTKIGEGTLVLDNAENDFTGGISVLTGYVNAAKSGSLGTGKVSARNGVAGGIIFSAPNGEFSNAMGKYNQHGGFMTFKADTTLHGAIEAIGCQSYMNVDEGVRVVFKGDMDLGMKKMQLDTMKGTMVFEGKLTGSPASNEQGIHVNLTGTEGGKIVFCNQGNAFRVLNIGHIVHVCSNENVLVGTEIKTRSSTDAGYVDLNGYDQKIKAIGRAGSVAKWNNTTVGRILSEDPVTLTMTGTGAGMLTECNCLITGKVSIVMDADPAFTNKFMHRQHRMDGDITVKSGVFDLAGENTCFFNVPKISIGGDGVFLSDSSLVTASLPAVTNLAIASGGRFEILNDTLGKHHNPFTQGRLHLELAPDSSLKLMDDICLTVNTFRVSGVYQHKGLYTNAKCPAIKTGSVQVLNGPKYGIVFTVR